MDDILERPRSFEVQASARIAELERALRHAQEAIFWYHAEGFEMDGGRIGDVIKSALRQS